MTEKRFSERYGFQPNDTEISVHYDAPYELRGIVLDIAYEAGLGPSSLRSIICQLLRKREDPSNWSEYPNIASEVTELIDGCEWYDVYNIIEAIYKRLKSRDEKSHTETSEFRADYFTAEINKYFRRVGIGWQLNNGEITIRGTEAFEQILRSTNETLELTGRQTASREMHQALLDLSRRPDPDITGAIQHAIAALECVLRDIAGDPKSTLGSLLKKYPNLLPPPLDQVVDKAWAYASERGRHLREGRTPDLEEAELVVGLAGIVATYISKKTIGET